MADTATELLTEFGQALTLTRQSAGSYDPATGSATVTTSTQSGVGAVFEWSPGSLRNGQEFMGNSLIKVGDKQLLLSATGVTPNLGDTVTIGSIVYTLVAPLKSLNPAGTVVMYECNIRT